MTEYEFVPKKEYQPIRKELEEIIRKVQDEVRDKFTFQYKLVGSGKRHLITREIGGNKGFDFDYNLILNNPDEDHFWKPEFAKITLLNAFRKVLKNTSYKDPEDSTSVITIKVVDKQKSRIVHSCDFSIIYYPNDEDYSYFKYVRNNKNPKNNYTWEVRSSSKNYDEKLDYLFDTLKNAWNCITREYLKVKNNNKDPNKHSFQLYLEAINNLYNRV